MELPIGSIRWEKRNVVYDKKWKSGKNRKKKAMPRISGASTTSRRRANKNCTLLFIFYIGFFVNKQLKVSTKCDVIYNPLVGSFTNIINAPHIKRKNTIVFLGKIIKTKGAFNLIKAFNIFAKRHPEYRLIMIGGGNIDKGKLQSSNIFFSKWQEVLCSIKSYVVKDCGKKFQITDLAKLY